jgi:thiosulfate/3-mercaptopyruvate sulfurtransferase
VYTTLISVAELKNLQDQGAPLMVFDCSFELLKPEAADELYAQAHIPGALQAHLERNLSTHDAALAVNAGRHPLPSRESFANWLGEQGLTPDMQVVVYDRQGANYCGRLWWMLKWVGHNQAAVLDGGLQAWQAAGGEMDSAAPSPRPPAKLPLRPALLELAHTTKVAQNLGLETQTVIDARAAARYRGEVEPLDPVAGHIPGALNRPFNQNLNAEGFFKSPEVLCQEFNDLLAGRDPSTVVHHCGSGVSAVPNVLAMAIAGLGPTALYAGSWSEWCNTPGLPCAKG